MALFEVVLKQSFAGQEVINRWNYLGSGTPAAVSLSFGLVSAMGFVAGGEPPVFPSGTLFHKMRQIQAPNISYAEVICANVFDPLDFYTTNFPVGTTGLDNQGDARQSFAAAGFRTNIVNRDIARGTKRIAGIPEGWTGPNNALNPTYLANMEALATEMGATITYDDEGNTLTYQPCIVQKEKYTTPRGRTAYRYYPSLTVQLSHIASGIRWEVYNTVRSQVSRQLGKGG